MNAIRPQAAATTATARATAADCLELCKVRLVSLVLFTTGIGFVVGYPGEFGWAALSLLVHAVLGTGLVACGSMAINQVIERDVDAAMHRTAHRPVPQGRIGVVEAWLFGLVLSVSGVGYLLLTVNPVAAGLALLTSLVYLAVYTPLKRVSTLNTVVGAVSGAVPPMIGYAAAAGGLGIGAWVLFGILFVWQVPHFLGIAWMYRDDYARARLAMLPVVDHDGVLTARQIVLYSMTLLLISLLPSVMSVAGPVYFALALLLGVLFVACAWPILARRDRRTARQVFLASVAYLPLLLMALVLDRV